MRIEEERRGCRGELESFFKSREGIVEGVYTDHNFPGHNLSRVIVDVREEGGEKVGVTREVFLTSRQAGEMALEAGSAVKMGPLGRIRKVNEESERLKELREQLTEFTSVVD